MYRNVPWYATSARIPNYMTEIPGEATPRSKTRSVRRDAASMVASTQASMQQRAREVAAANAASLSLHIITVHIICICTGARE